jgi:hypothetical protein
LTFLDVGSFNVSFSASVISRIGGFDPAFGADCVREAALRACAEGVELRRAGARATISCQSTFEQLALLRRDAGEALARMAVAHGDLAPVLQRTLDTYGSSSRTDRLLDVAPAIHACAALLRGLEWLRMRRRWAQLAEALLAASFRRGVATVHHVSVPRRPKVSTIDIDSDRPLSVDPLGAVPSALRVRGEPAGFVDSLQDAWLPSAGAEIAREIDPRAWAPLIAEVTDSCAPVVAALPSLTVLLPSAVAGECLASDGVHLKLLRPSADAASFWRLADEAIRSSTSELVAVPLPGRNVSNAWATETRLALSGSSIGLAAGIGLADHWAAQPIQFLSESCGVRMDRRITALDFIAVRRSTYIELGGFRHALGAVGHRTPPCNLLRRHLAAGGTAAWTIAPGIAVVDPHSPDGNAMVGYGAALGASARDGDQHGKGFLLMTALGLMAGVPAAGGGRRALGALYDVLRFARGVAVGITADHG